jgi:peptide deformylase
LETNRWLKTIEVFYSTIFGTSSFMAKLKIYTFPDQVLARKADPIQRVEKSLWSLAEDMLETMYFAPGVGLAANQVGILKRILVIDTEYTLEEEESASDRVIANRKPFVMINPEIIYREGWIEFSEGCLSVPDYTAEVKRSEKIKVAYQDQDGVGRTLMADGLLAVAVQHEIDHLEGRLFIDRLTPLKKQMIRKKLRLRNAGE